MSKKKVIGFKMPMSFDPLFDNPRALGKIKALGMNQGKIISNTHLESSKTEEKNLPDNYACYYDKKTGIMSFLFERAINENELPLSFVKSFKIGSTFSLIYREKKYI